MQKEHRITTAIVRKPPQSFKNILTKNPYLNKPDWDLAIREHKRYVTALEDAGVEKIIEMDLKEDFPLSMAVEDVAIIFPGECVIITNNNDKTRINEANDIKEYIMKNFPKDQIHTFNNRSKIRGADVLIIGNNVFVGVSSFTNSKGIKSLTKILKKYNKQVVQINTYDFLYLKAGISYIGDNTILIAEQLVNKNQFQTFKRIIVPKDELYAINSFSVNGKVIIPMGYPRTLAAIRKLGFKPIALNLSEFKKIDIGSSLLSLRY